LYNTNTHPNPFLFNKNSALSAKCSELHQVCALDRPRGAKPLYDDALTLPWASRFHLLGCVKLSMAFGLFLALAAPALASDWTNVASTTTWQSRDAFGAPQSASLRGLTTRSFSLNGKDAVVTRKGDKLDQLLAMIALEEGPAGYNAVNLQAKVKPPKQPVDMTIAEIFKWIGDTPGQQHAIGRYQIIPSTLARLVEKLGVSHRARFDANLQDKFGRTLAREAGYDAFANGTLGPEKFMDKLAAVWAALPDQKGRSVYHGIAGNRATISRAKYRSRMAAIFPRRMAP